MSRLAKFLDEHPLAESSLHPTLSPKKIRLALEAMIVAERGDELERFILADDSIRRDELKTVDPVALIRSILDVLRDEFGFDAKHPTDVAAAIACTRPGVDVFDEAGFFLAYVPRSE